MPEPERDDSDDSESGAMLPGPGVSERRVQDPGRSAPSQGTRCKLRQQSSRLLMPVMPVMLTGALLRIRCCHAGTSCGRHCPNLLERLLKCCRERQDVEVPTTNFVGSVLKVGNVWLTTAVGALVEIAPASSNKLEVAAAVFPLGEFTHD